jgi:hypothetical protein
MRIVKLKNANGSVIAVTNTATLLTALLTTAVGENQPLPDALDAVLLNPEDGDVRILADGNDPSTTKGLLLKQGGFYKFVGISVSQIKLIRTGGSNVAVGVQVGFAEQGESSFASGTGSSSSGAEYTEGDTDASIAGKAIMWEDTSDTLRPVSATKPLPVEIKNALEAVDSGGAEADSIGAAPFRRTDSFHARFNGARSTSVQEVKAATASKKHYITDLLISTDTAGWVTIVDGAATVLCGPYYMPANSVLPRRLATPIPGSTNTALNVDCDAATGNVTVEIDGYTI